MARFAAFAWATLAWVFPNMKFNVTRKGSRARRLLRFTAPQWLVVGSNLLGIPAGWALYHARVLPLATVAANTLWAATNAGLGTAVLRHTLKVQRRKRAHYRFPVPLPAKLHIGGFLARGTIDDLTENGLRFCGPLPAGLEVGSGFTGRLTLPDGPLRFTGTVRSLIARPDHPQVLTGFGGLISTSADDQLRIERFLFGSDMQWLINGYSDQTQTPLSHFFPEHVPGPHRSAFRDLRWNAAEIRRADGGLFQVLLSASAGMHAQNVWLLSFSRLPERRPLRLECFGGQEVATQRVHLQRAHARHQLGGPTFVYRVAGMQRHIIEQLVADDQEREVA
jgi:cellulose synthase (UDP-forming)